jgi:hypothetical protein
MKRTTLFTFLIFLLLATSLWAIPPSPPVSGDGTGDMTKAVYDTNSNNVVDSAATATTAGNLSGTPTLPNGTAATTQSQSDNSTKLATTAYVDTGLGGKAASDASTTVNGQSCALGSSCTVTGNLSSNPSACTAGQYVTDIAADGTLTCDTPTGAAHDAVTLGSTATPILGLSTQEIGFDTQTANYVLAGPTTGAAAAPTFRALVSADIPSNAADTSGTAAKATALAADPADCAAGQVATGIAASGALSCTATPSVTTLTGNVTGNVTGNADTATAFATLGTANQLYGMDSAGTEGEWKSTINILMDDSAAQFSSATASKGTRQLVQSSISNGILLTDTPVITGNVTWTNLSQGAGTWTRVFEEAANVFTVKQEFDATTGLQVGSTGVLITSDNDGAITFLGASGGYDEDLTINLDDTENTAVVSSSTGVTKIDFGSIALVATGQGQIGMTINSDADGMTSSAMATAGMYGTMFFATGAGTWALPGAVAGMNFCVYSTGANAIIINPDDADVIVLNGAALSAGDSITSASAAGDFICLVALDATNWYTLGRSGTWTDTN